jgi:hypothetical protein
VVTLFREPSGRTCVLDRSDEPDDPDPEARWGDPEARWGDPEARWGDPEARWGDPERELPTVPEVRVPSVEVDPSETPDTPQAQAQAKAFWLAVVYANVGLGGVTVGPLVAVFRDMWLVGVAAFLVGLFALGRTYQIYRRFDEHDWVTDELAADEATGAGSGTGEDAERDEEDARSGAHDEESG